MDSSPSLMFIYSGYNQQFPLVGDSRREHKVDRDLQLLSYIEKTISGYSVYLQATAYRAGCHIVKMCVYSIGLDMGYTLTIYSKDSLQNKEPVQPLSSQNKCEGCLLTLTLQCLRCQGNHDYCALACIHTILVNKLLRNPIFYIFILQQRQKYSVSIVHLWHVLM